MISDNNNHIIYSLLKWQDTLLTEVNPATTKPSDEYTKQNLKII